MSDEECFGRRVNDIPVNQSLVCSSNGAITSLINASFNQECECSSPSIADLKKAMKSNGTLRPAHASGMTFHGVAGSSSLASGGGNVRQPGQVPAFLQKTARASVRAHEKSAPVTSAVLRKKLAPTTRMRKTQKYSDDESNAIDLDKEDNDDDEEEIESENDEDRQFINDEEEESEDEEGSESSDDDDSEFMGGEIICTSSSEDEEDIEAKLRREDEEYADEDVAAREDGFEEWAVTIAGKPISIAFTSDETVALYTEAINEELGTANALNKGVTINDIQTINRLRRAVQPTSIAPSIATGTSCSVQQLYKTLFDLYMYDIYQFYPPRQDLVTIQLRAFAGYRTRVVAPDDIDTHVMAFRTWYALRELLRRNLLQMNVDNPEFCDFLEAIRHNEERPMLDYPIIDLNEDDDPDNPPKLCLTTKSDSNVIGFSFLDGATKKPIATLWYDQGNEATTIFANAFIRFWFMPWYIQQVIAKRIRPLWAAKAGRLQTKEARDFHYNQVILPIIYEHIGFARSTFESLLVGARIECGEHVCQPYYVT